MTRCVLVGVGNAYRGRRRRRARGGRAAARIRVPAGVEVVTCEQEASRVIDALEGRDAAVLVDAGVLGRRRRGRSIDSTRRRAQCRRGRSGRRPTPSGSARRSSSHARSESCPPVVIVYGVEGSEFAAGEGLSEAVAAAVEPAAVAILAELATLTEEREPCTSGR